MHIKDIWFPPVVLALLIVFAVVGLVALPSFTEYLWRWSHFAVILVFGFVASSLGMMGAGDAKYAAAKKKMAGRLMGVLKSTNDPRVTGDGTTFDKPPFTSPVKRRKKRKP